MQCQDTEENPSNTGQLDLKRSNNSTVVDSSNDFDTDPENTNLNYSEYETNEQDLNQLNVCIVTFTVLLISSARDLYKIALNIFILNWVL